MKQLVFLVATAALALSAKSCLAQRTPRTDKATSAESRPVRSAACGEVSGWIARTLHAPSANAYSAAGAERSLIPEQVSMANLGPRDLDCDAVPSLLLPGTPLQLTKIFFDRTLHSWEFLVRCLRAEDCVPFLVRWPQPAAGATIDRRLAAQDRFDRGGALVLRPAASDSSIPPRRMQNFLLRPGQTVKLLWDQNGIRVLLPAICMDRGNLGESIRVRTKGGSVLRAEIVSESLLRAIS